MGAELGPFWLNRRLAGGRTGEVWTGVHRAQGVQVAVKFLTVTKSAAAFRAVFMREVEILAQLDHPNVVRIWDHGTVPVELVEPLGGKVKAGAPYLVMEQGRATLGDRRDRLPWSRVRQVAVDLLAALAHAHAHGLLHRDIKPGNVLLCPAEREGERHRVVLTDFGFAGPSGEETEVVGLTPAYAAPEQLAFSARDEGPWTDLFALGGVLWTLLTGRSPYPADTVEEATAAHLRPLPRLEGLAPEIEGWIRALLAIAPADRPRSAAEALHALLVAEARRPILREVPVDWRRPEVHRAGPRNLAGTGLGLVGIRSGSVAREAERDQLWARMRSAAMGRAQVAVLRGAEGIGKTHLARWVGALAHERCGATELVVNGTTEGDGLVAMLRRRIGLQGLDPRAARARVGLWLEATGGAGWLEARAVLRTLEPGPVGPDRHGAIADLLRRVARSAPLVVRIEDAHRLDEVVPFASYVLAERPELPALFVLTARDDAPVPAIPAGALELRLGPLTAAECDRLLAEQVGLAPALRGAVANACMGIPGVAERLLRRFAAEGSLELDADGCWHRPRGAWAGLRDDELAPAWERFEAALRGRPDADRQAVELAGVLGPEVASAEYTSCLRHVGVVAPDLPDRLVAAGLWVPASGGWRFADGRAAAAAAREAERSGRGRRWNEVVAGVLARVPGPVAQVRRARHLVRAGRVEEALAPWRRGLEAWLEEQPPATTAAALEELARATASLRLPPEDPRTTAPEELEAALWLVAGEPARARRLADALAARPEAGPDARSAALRVRARLHLEAFELDLASTAAGEAFAAAAAPEPRGLALLAIGAIDLRAGRIDEGARRLDEALAAAGGIASVEAEGLLARAGLALARGDRIEAREALARAAPVIDRTGREGLGWRLRVLLGRLALAGGDEAAALGHLAAARAACEGAGQVEAARRVDVPYGAALLARGDGAAAAAAFGRAQGASDLAVRAAALAGRVAVAARAGDLAAVDARLAELRAIPGVARAVLPDAGELLAAASRALGDPGRSAAIAALARAALEPLGRGAELDRH